MKNANLLVRNSFRLVLPVRSLALLCFLVVVLASPALAKRNDDRVVLDNGDRITGEIKKVENGTLYFKPGYALDSIQIDWTRVAELQSQDRFTVALTSGIVHTGEIKKETGERSGAAGLFDHPR